MRIDVRPREEADLEALVAGIRLVHELDNYPRHFPDDPMAWLQPPRQRQAWVAVTSGGAIAGHVALNVAEGDPALGVASAYTGLPAERLAVVARLFVVPAFRRVGVARALLGVAVEAAHAAGKRPSLDVLQVDEGAIAMYEAVGWEPAGEVIFTSPRTGERMPGFVFAGPPPAKGPLGRGPRMNLRASVRPGHESPGAAEPASHQPG